MIRHQDRDRLIVKYYQEGKSYRQIAQLARISVRDIKPILEKYGADKAVEYSDTDGEIVDSDSLMPISSRAYKLFAEEFMTPLEVAIALNLEAKEAMRYHDEFLELNGRGILAKLFKEIGNEGISWLLHMCAVAGVKKISISQIIEYVSIYGEDLPMIKQLCEDARKRLEALHKQEYQLEIRLEYLKHLAEKLADDVKSKQIESEKAEKIRREILAQALRLRGVISNFKNNNTTYRKIEQFVEQSIDRILRERENMKLLEFALISVLKSLPGKDQYKYRYLLHKLDLVEVSGSLDIPTATGMMTTDTYPQIESNTIVMRNKNPHSVADHYQHSYLSKKGDHCPACYEKEILAMSKMYFEMLRKQMTDEIKAIISQESLFKLRSISEL